MVGIFLLNFRKNVAGLGLLFLIFDFLSFGLVGHIFPYWFSLTKFNLLGNDEILARKWRRVNKNRVSGLFEQEADELSEDVVQGGNENADRY